MVSSDFRKEAREKLSGKWSKAVCINLAYMLVFFLFNILESLCSDIMQSFLSLVFAIIEVPLSLGLIISFVKLFNDEDVKAFDFLTTGFNNFGKSWGIAWNIFVKMVLPVILTVVSYVIIVFGIFQTASSSMLYETSSSTTSIVLVLIGIVLFIAASIWSVTKSYYYQLAYIIAADKPELSSKEAVEESEKLMTGKRGKLFCLQLSFIGWAILAVFTLGIGYLWLIPYVQIAIIAFYKFACGDSENKEIDGSVIVENEE